METTKNQSEEKEIASLTTGYRRGYVRVCNRFIEHEINLDLAKKSHKNSNTYNYVMALIKRGATRVTVSSNQHANSSQYCYDIYTGYCYGDCEVQNG